MGERQNKVFMEGIEHAKSQIVLMIAPMDRILLHVFEGVMHPTHVPLEAETEAADVTRSRNHRPGSRFLGDGLHVWMVSINRFIQAAQKFNGLDIFPAAVFIGN